MSDFISREAAIAAVAENDVVGAIRALRALPPAQEAAPSRHAGYLRVSYAFDSDETASSFLRPDGEGGFASGVYRMAREIERLRSLPAVQGHTMGAAPALAPESSDMPYRIFTDTSRVWLDDDDGGSLFAYVREGAAPAVKVKPLVWASAPLGRAYGGGNGILYWVNSKLCVLFKTDNEIDTWKHLPSGAHPRASIYAAKAAAQADYEARILSALEGGDA